MAEVTSVVQGRTTSIIQDMNTSAVQEINTHTVDNVNTFTDEKVNTCTMQEMNLSAVYDLNTSNADEVNNTATVQNVNTSTLQEVNVYAAKVLNTSTVQDVNTSTLQEVNVYAAKVLNTSTVQDVNTSTLQEVNVYADKVLNTSTVQDVNTPTILEVNASTNEEVNISTVREINTPDYEEVNVSTIQEVNTCIDQEHDDSDDLDTGEEEFELPSTVRDRLQIYMPPDKTSDDPRIYGKWMWFSNGDLYHQDEIWSRLQSLLENNTVLLLESSTARKSRQGVIKCYTCEDKIDIIRVGLAVQNIVDDDVILFYKTCQASKDSLNRRFGDRFITKYMLTVNGRFYERDGMDRWNMILDSELCSSLQDESTYNIQEIHSGGTVDVKYIPPHKKKLLIDSKMLPSQENASLRYDEYSREYTNFMEPVGLWHMFCDVTDFDTNCLTELDRVWIKAKELLDEGVFIRISAETNAYFNYSGDANVLRRTITCYIKNYRDIANVIETGSRLLERTKYPFPIYLKTIQRDYKFRYFLRYLFTESGELYKYCNEQWKLFDKGLSSV